MNCSSMKSYGEFTPEELEKMPPCPYFTQLSEEERREDENIVWLVKSQKWAYWDID